MRITHTNRKGVTFYLGRGVTTVSYTHLTLPTTILV